MALRLSHRFAQALGSGAARQALRTVLNQTVPVNAVLSLTTSLSQQFNLQKLCSRRSPRSMVLLLEQSLLKIGKGFAIAQVALIPQNRRPRLLTASEMALPDVEREPLTPITSAPASAAASAIAKPMPRLQPVTKAH